jgi:hypothetical protein
MLGGSSWRAVVASALVALLIVALGCESGPATGPTAPRETSTVPPFPAPGPVGAIGGTVTINGEARPIVWVELQRGSWPWAYGTTIPSGSWEWGQVPAGDYDVVIKTPPGLTCDATRKSATVRTDQRTVVNFACFGDEKGSILGFTSAEFGTVASARLTLTGPVNRETMSNRDGFFAFEDLPPGEYLIEWCKNPNPVRASIRDGATAFVTVDCS